MPKPSSPRTLPGIDYPSMGPWGTSTLHLPRQRSCQPIGPLPTHSYHKMLGAGRGSEMEEALKTEALQCQAEPSTMKHADADWKGQGSPPLVHGGCTVKHLPRSQGKDVDTTSPVEQSLYFEHKGMASFPWPSTSTKPSGQPTAQALAKSTSSLTSPDQLAPHYSCSPPLSPPLPFPPP